MDVRYSALKVGSDGIFWRQKAGAGFFFDDSAFLAPAGFFSMTRLFEKAGLLFGDESWENNGTHFPASFIRRFGELPLECTKAGTGSVLPKHCCGLILNLFFPKIQGKSLCADNTAHFLVQHSFK